MYDTRYFDFCSKYISHALYNGLEHLTVRYYVIVLTLCLTYYATCEKNNMAIMT